MSKPADPRQRRGYRWGVLSRVLAAAVGGYVLTALVLSLLVVVLPGSRAERVALTTMCGFALYTAIVIAVFSARSALRAWLLLLLPSLMISLLLMAF